MRTRNYRWTVARQTDSYRLRAATAREVARSGPHGEGVTRD